MYQLHSRVIPHLECLQERCVPAVFTVTTFADTPALSPAAGTGLDADGQISLRSAIQAAEFTAEEDTIILAAGEYALTRSGTGGDAGPLEVRSGEVTINGAGSALTTIRANYGTEGAGRVISIRTMSTATEATIATINGVTITGGQVTESTGFNGGGVLNQGGIVSMTDVSVVNNWVRLASGGSATGGGIRNEAGGPGGSFAGLLTLTDSVVSDNEASGTNGGVKGLGGGIYNASSFPGGDLLSGQVTLIRTVISGNLALGSGVGADGLGASTGQGGGLYNEFGGVLVITDSLFLENIARGGPSITDVVPPTVPPSPPVDKVYGVSGEGGGVFSDFGTITIVSGSTFAGNRAEGGLAEYTGDEDIGAQGGVGTGGGILVRDGITVVNSTFSGNVAVGGTASGGTSNADGFSGGGAITFAQVGDGNSQSITNSTVTLNESGFGGGLWASTGTPGPLVQSTIVAGNLVTGANTDVFGTFASAGNNLIGDSAGTESFGAATGDLVDVPAGLAPLGDYGGPTPTHALLASSDAIDAGAQPAAGDLEFDQRGFARVVGSSIDIGAVEYTAPVAVGDAYNATAGDELVIAGTGVLGNDIDPFPGVGLTAMLVSDASNGILTLNADGTFTYTPDAAFVGTDNFTYLVADAAGNMSSAATVTLTVTAPDSPPTTNPPPTTSPPTTNPPTGKPPSGNPPSNPPPSGSTGTSSSFLIGGPANGAAAIAVANGGGVTANERIDVFPGLGVSIRVVTADVTGDGVADFIAGTGPGVPTQVIVIDGASRTVLATIRPYESSFTGGVFVAAGDLTGDGIADIVVTPDEGGGPRVQVYGAVEFRLLADFLGIDDPNFRGGARTAVGDINGDGRDDLIVAAGFGGGPRVAIYDGNLLLAATGAGLSPPKLMNDFFAFEEGLRNGVYVAAGDFAGLGRDVLVFGGGPGGGPRVRIVDGMGLINAGNFSDLDDLPALTLANFFAGDPNDRGGVRVAAVDVFDTGRDDLVVGSGENSTAVVGIYPAAEIVRSPNLPTVANVLSPFMDDDGLFGAFVG